MKKHVISSRVYLEIDDEEKVRKMVALPSPWYPSDHIAIVADLEFL